jgi:DNA repair protein RecN (Recombination protein N)
MLKFLNISNVAVINRLSFELYNGLNLLTGETGAGKSIIVDALGLMLGRRGGADLIRSGERMATIEGGFELNPQQRHRVQSVLNDVAVDLISEEILLIRKEVHRTGRNRIFVNDQYVAASTLKIIQPLLLEIVGQSEQYALSSAHSHLDMLDSFAKTEDLRLKTSVAYANWRKATKALEVLKQDESERGRLSDFLQYQITEIEKVNPEVGEDQRLLDERTLLVHSERALELSAQGYYELYESDQSVLTKMGILKKSLQELSAIDGRVGIWVEFLETANATLTEVADGLRGFGNGIDFSRNRLEEIEDRLAELAQIKRKYGRELGELLALKVKLCEQLEQMQCTAERVSEIEHEIEAAKKEYIKLAGRLSDIRRKAARRLEKRVMDELGYFAMERALFIVSFGEESSDKKVTSEETQDYIPGQQSEADTSFWMPSGIDHVEFLLSANPGEAPRPLIRVASGGELSRLMLALRTVCQMEADTELDGSARAAVTLIFDEIDTGIGGKTAEAVGRRLKELSGNQQVICVTHQAQIARFADHHYAVSKRVEEGRTVTTIRTLDAEERVGELARMIGGAEDIESAREAARWMLGDEGKVEHKGAKKRTRESKKNKANVKASSDMGS